MLPSLNQAARREPPGLLLPNRRVAQDDEVSANLVAKILGEHSAAAHALAELARRRTSGEDAFITEARGTWWVGCWPKEENTDGT